MQKSSARFKVVGSICPDDSNLILEVDSACSVLTELASDKRE